MGYADWKPVSTRLLRRSEKWKQINDRERVLYLHLLLLSDGYGVIEGSTTMIWAVAGEPFGMTVAQVEKALSKLESVNLVQKWNDGADWTQIIGYDEILTADMKRKRGKRVTPLPPKQKNSEFAGKGALMAELGRPNGRVRAELGQSNDALKAPPDIDRDIDRDIDKLVLINQNLSNPNSTAQKKSDTETIFNHWVTTEQQTGGTGNRKLTNDRKTKITARLREGYTVEEICQAITAYCNDPWHQGDNDRNKRYTDLTTILKSGSKVEAGIAMSGAAAVQSRYSTNVPVKAEYAHYDDNAVRVIDLINQAGKDE